MYMIIGQIYGFGKYSENIHVTFLLEIQAYLPGFLHFIIPPINNSWKNAHKHNTARESIG